MFFKQSWEQTSSLAVPKETVAAMLQLAGVKTNTCRPISGGCTNINYKLDGSFVLRVYLYDPSAAFREQKLAEFLKPTVPIPLTFYCGALDGFSFSITEYLPGISLRALLLGQEYFDMKDVMRRVGNMLSIIGVHQFDKSGFLDKNLNILERFSDDFPLDLAYTCANNPKILQKSDILKIKRIFEEYGQFFPPISEKNLVHGDFDPSNILVDKKDGVWVVSGVLDWECAFSGTILFDVATMLRYAHKMPHSFEEAFLEGLNFKLPKTWKISVDLLNLLALLDLLRKIDVYKFPKTRDDILGLIYRIIDEKLMLKKNYVAF